MTNLALLLAAIVGALLGVAFAALLARSRGAALAERPNGLEQAPSAPGTHAEPQAAESKLSFRSQVVAGSDARERTA